MSSDIVTLGYHTGRAAPNKGKTYPPEVLTPDEVKTLIRSCSNRAPTGIRNRALITVMYRAGLRLSESLELYWDRDDRLCVDLSGHHPMLAIPGELEKGGKDRLLPVAPEFAEFLLATPEAERTGPVFNPIRISSDVPRSALNRSSAASIPRAISTITSAWSARGTGSPVTAM